MTEPPPLLDRELREAARVRKQCDRLRPQVHVRRHVRGHGLPGGVLVDEEVVFGSLDAAIGEGHSELLTDDVAGSSPKRLDCLCLASGSEPGEADATPIRRAQERTRHGDRFPQPIREYAQADHLELVEISKHLAGDRARDDRPFQRVAIDQHRRPQSLKTVDSEGVEHAGPHRAKVDPAGFHVADGLLLRPWFSVPPPANGFDAQIAARELTNPNHEVRDGEVGR